eukprot:407078-Pleurochrysis_carterae.AAC.1
MWVRMRGHAFPGARTCARAASARVLPLVHTRRTLKSSAAAAVCIAGTGTVTAAVVPARHCRSRERCHQRLQRDR